MKCGRRVEKMVKRRGWWQVYFSLLSGQGWRPDPLAADPLPAAAPNDQRSESLILDS